MPSDEAPDIAETLGRLWPEMRQAQYLAWAASALCALVALQAVPPTMRFLREDSHGFDEFQAYVLIVAVIGLFAVYGYIRRHHERMVMPELAHTLGLSYRDSDDGFVQALPPRLLPKASRRKAEDVLNGRIGDRAVTFAEVKVETGGKNSTVYFDGIVMEFQNVAQMPAFFVAAEKETRGWFGFAGNIRIDDLARIDSVLQMGEAFGVWASSPSVADHPGFRAVLARLTGTSGDVDVGARLYSAMCDGTRTWVAIRQRRDLFRIGGLLATRDNVLDDIRRAYEDVQQPYRIVASLLKAEEAAAGKG